MLKIFKKLDPEFLELENVVKWTMFVLKSFAKINLGLEVVNRRPDGYHNLRTIFQTIDWFDTISLQPNDCGKLRLNGTGVLVDWAGPNTISQTFELMASQFRLRKGFDVTIEKKIPPGSGMGGGSSNAAVIIKFLNQYYQLNLSLAEMNDLARKIGADVPFFLVGGTALGEGIGEIITPLTDLECEWSGIVVPRVSVSTRLIFSKLNLTSSAIKSKITIFIKTRDFKILENHLEETVFKLFPEVGLIKEKMLALNSELVLMTGSGGAVFCLLKDSELVHFKRLFTNGVICKVIKRVNYNAIIGA